MIPHLSDLRCEICGAVPITAIAPGLEAVRMAAISLRTRRSPVVEGGQPDRAWCEPCWKRRFGTRRARRAKRTATLEGAGRAFAEIETERRLVDAA